MVIPVVGPFDNDTLWVGDRLVTPVDVGSHLTHGPQMTRSVDSMLLLSVAAAATSRMRLNTSMLSTSYYEPSHLARPLTKLDVLSSLTRCSTSPAR